MIEMKEIVYNDGYNTGLGNVHSTALEGVTVTYRLSFQGLNMKAGLIVCLCFCLAVIVTEGSYDCISGAFCAGREAVRNPSTGQIFCCHEGSYPVESFYGGFDCKCHAE
ncbi:hypothetical protein RRG08_004033 [Elysia crispata]|uniref:Uncharacterized protein n=1 Tax=Elysia crispata TaxID=231223 RepID=A0AAE1AMM2_9GAST|nr:hypothetical protein RRG08_004033 [Elysia crispata]